MEEKIDNEVEIKAETSQKEQKQDNKKEVVIKKKYVTAILYSPIFSFLSVAILNLINLDIDQNYHKDYYYDIDNIFNKHEIFFYNIYTWNHYYDNKFSIDIKIYLKYLFNEIPFTTYLFIAIGFIIVYLMLKSYKFKVKS